MKSTILHVLRSLIFLLCFAPSDFSTHASPVSARASNVAIDGTVLSPLKATSRWLVDSNGKRVKLRCVNWAGHLETRIPEGLQHQPVATIAAFIGNYGFNCVRLTYSIDGVLNPTTKASDAFTQASQRTGADLTSVWQSAVKQNPWLGSATLASAFDTVIEALNARGIRVVMDNQMSRAGWCCGTTDGNGWWNSAAGYDAGNSQYFDTNAWLSGLAAVATMAKKHANVVAMDLRNEPRAVGSQDGNNHADWYNLTKVGAQRIQATNPNLVITFGGPSYETDLSFIGSKSLDVDSWGGAAKTAYEAHIYSWSSGGLTNADCSTLVNYAGRQWGYLIGQNQAYTGPLWVSEFGAGLSGGDGSAAQKGLSADDYNYLNCLRQYLESNDADWAIWALQGDYYVRDGKANEEETFGVLDKNWQNPRNDLHALLGKMFNVTQGPGI